MELLLNLVWLLLALPACWLWHASRLSPAGRKSDSLQRLLAVGCMLVVLFPVISATDDLRAMQTEMEESPASKRTIRQAGIDKVSAWKWQNPPALAGTATSLMVSDEDWQSLPAPRLSVATAPAIERAGRAPPHSLPG